MTATAPRPIETSPPPRQVEPGSALRHYLYDLEP